MARRQSYHGATLGSSAWAVIFNVAKSSCPRCSPTPNTSPCYAYRGQLNSETEMEYGLADERGDVPPKKLAGVIGFVAETVVGATAGCVAAPGYFKRIREL